MTLQNPVRPVLQEHAGTLPPASNGSAGPLDHLVSEESSPDGRHPAIPGDPAAHHTSAAHERPTFKARLSRLEVVT